MLITGSFDRENQKQRQERAERNKMQTAEKLNDRIKHFIKNVDDSIILKGSQKNKIKRELFKDLLIKLK